MPALSTWSRPPAGTPAALVARARAVGATGLALDATLQADFLEGLGRAIPTAEAPLPVVAVEAPCPRPPGSRPPWLASEDKEERLAAAAGTVTSLEVAATHGARVVIVRLGVLPMRHGWPETVRAFGRRSLGERAVQRRLEERAKLRERALDLARFGLDGVLGPAAASGQTIALVNRGRWFEIPDEEEIAQLLEDFRGAPLALWIDPAAAHVRETMGFSRRGALLERFATRAAGAWLTDAAGLQGGLPWGRGEVDRAALTKALPAEALQVVHAAPFATDEELALALAGVSSAR